MKTNLLATLAALTVFALFAFVAWCGGYDFNERGPGVAMATTYALLFGVCAFAGVKCLL